MGDSVLTTPLIKAVKQKNPEASISFCVRPENVELFEGIDIIDEVIPFDKRGEEKGIGGILRFAKLLKSKNFDIVFSAHRSFRTTAALALSGIPEKIGFVESSFSMIYTKSIAKDMTLHEIERNLLLYFIHYNEVPQGIIKPFVYTDEKITEDFKQKHGSKLVGINPGSVWATKMWPAEYYAQVADWLKENGYTPVIIGAPSDKPAADKIVQSSKYDLINICGETSLRELPSIIAAFDMMVTNDSGPLHIAVSTDVPCVAIFGPTVKELGFYPYDENSRIAEVEGLPCRPCGLHGHKECPKKHFRCMLEVTPENVISLFKDVTSPLTIKPKKPKYETVKVD
jgi:heptosyltransferase-2